MTSPTPPDSAIRTPEEKATLTLNLSEKEMRILSELAKKQETTKTQILKNALRLYQYIEQRIDAGDRLWFKNDKKLINKAFIL